MTLEKSINWLEQNRGEKKVVLVTGVFDLLHEEHLKFLQKAKEAGDILVVGVESDLRVRQLKGENRPIWDQNRRVATIEATKLADVVFVLPEQFSKPEEHELLISKIKPDLLAVSAHSPHQDGKRQIMKKFGGQLVVVHDHNPAVSTTLKLEKKKS